MRLPWDSDDLDLDDEDATGSPPQELDFLDAGEAEEEQPIRRSGIAAALDGNAGASESSDAKEEKEVKVPVPIAAGAAGGLDLDSLFEEEFVSDPTLKDLAESMDDVSAVDLAADLRTFLEELQ